MRVPCSSLPRPAVVVGLLVMLVSGAGCSSWLSRGLNLERLYAAQPGFFPIAYAVFICRSHAEQPSDMTFRDRLLDIPLY